MPLKRIYFYPLWLRIWHWINGAGIIILILTGFIMHWGIHGSVIDFNIAVTLHNVTGIIVAISYFFFFIGTLLFYNSRYYRIRLRGWQSRIYKQAQYYLYGMFKGEKPPFPLNERRKFNPLQKTSYFYVMFLFLPLIVFTGIGLMYPELIIDKVYRYNGVFLTAMFHAALGFILFIFLLVHIYASTIGYDPLANFRSMINGWHEIHDHQEEGKDHSDDDEFDEEYPAAKDHPTVDPGEK
jgi:thiosulfate reductase cytochrome b subunit